MDSACVENGMVLMVPCNALIWVGMFFSTITYGMSIVFEVARNVLTTFMKVPTNEVDLETGSVTLTEIVVVGDYLTVVSVSDETGNVDTPKANMSSKTNFSDDCSELIQKCNALIAFCNAKSVGKSE